MPTPRILLCTLLLAGTAFASDEKALQIESEMVEAMGGRDRWNEARFFRFTFVRGDRKPRFTWDKWTGRLRLESRNQNGIPFVVLMNVNSRQGKAFVDGEPVTGAELSEYLNLGYRMWAGEIYWFLMPFKWRDEGVVLDYLGEEEIGGLTYDVVHLTFEGEGQSTDQYWAYVQRDNRLMERWRFELAAGFAAEFRWTGWERHGGLLLATERVGEDQTIRFEDVYVGSSVPDALFTSPEDIPFP